jgi:hypothetical protein
MLFGLAAGQNEVGRQQVQRAYYLAAQFCLSMQHAWTASGGLHGFKMPAQTALSPASWLVVLAREQCHRPIKLRSHPDRRGARLLSVAYDATCSMIPISPPYRVQ